MCSARAASMPSRRAAACRIESSRAVFGHVESEPLVPAHPRGCGGPDFVPPRRLDLRQSLDSRIRGNERKTDQRNRNLLQFVGGQPVGGNGTCRVIRTIGAPPVGMTWCGVLDGTMIMSP